MFFNYLQINTGRENDLLHIDGEVVYHIQALQSRSEIISSYIIISFLLLFFISVLHVLKQQNSGIAKVIPFLSSEQEAFKTFSKSTSTFTLNDLLCTFFFVVQISYLLLNLFSANEFVQVLNLSDLGFGIVVAVFLLLFFTLKYYISSQLSFLIQPNFEIKYYQFTYSYPLFFLALLLFTSVLIDINFKIDYGEIIYIIILCMFYVWLIIRWIFISLRYQTMKSLYFFLYLCALEVAPLLLIIGLS